MAKKKDNGGFPDWEKQEHLEGVIHKQDWDFITAINKQTVGHLGDIWIDNLRKNAPLWKSHGSIKDLQGLGKNKAVIGVGAGPSFNINKELFREVVTTDGMNDWEDKDFITIASNHQYKPLLEMGVIPDYVLLVDAGAKGVYEQLCEDISFLGQHTTLLTGLHCSPEIVNEWIKQDRPIKFFLPPTPKLMELFKELIGEDGKGNSTELGGNVMNGAWMISARMGCTVFMGLGNDLSFPMHNDVDKRRTNYYADGDYTTNAEESGSGRDEAKSQKIWGGFTLKRKKIILPKERYDISIDTVGTSPTLWVYKTWLETTVMGQAKQPVSMHYFNCSEAGILGVMAKSTNIDDMDKPDNWYLLDEKCHIYHTAMFRDAVYEYLKAKEMMERQWLESKQEHQDVQSAISTGVLR